MLFRVWAVNAPLYQEEHGQVPPDSLEVATLDELLASVKAFGHDVIIGLGSSLSDIDDNPTIIINNDILE